jgi:hypothetical protein
MTNTLWPLAAALVAGGTLLGSAPSSALPVGSVLSQDDASLTQQANWAHRFDRAGRRFFVRTKRGAPKSRVASNGNVERPDRPANQAQWGQMPGGGRRYGQ